MPLRTPALPGGGKPTTSSTTDHLPKKAAQCRQVLPLQTRMKEHSSVVRSPRGAKSDHRRVEYKVPSAHLLSTIKGEAP